MTEENKDHYIDLPAGFLPCAVDTTVLIDKYLVRNVPKRDMTLSHKSVITFPKVNPEKGFRKPRRRKNYITRQERQKFNLLKCPKKGWNYNAFAGLREMWTEYIRTHLDLGDSPPKVEDKDWPHFSLLLAKADYHGAEMTVVRSKCPSLVGITGTCIIDSKKTFRLLCPDNNCRTLPKQDSVFTISLTGMKLKIYGKYIMYKPADRSTRKIKSNMIPSL